MLRRLVQVGVVAVVLGSFMPPSSASPTDQQLKAMVLAKVREGRMPTATPAQSAPQQPAAPRKPTFLQNTRTRAAFFWHRLSSGHTGAGACPACSNYRAALKMPEWKARQKFISAPYR